jgi:hypothetical protein
VGIEPTTYALPRRCSTSELSGRREPNQFHRAGLAFSARCTAEHTLLGYRQSTYTRSRTRANGPFRHPPQGRAGHSAPTFPNAIGGGRARLIARSLAVRPAERPPERARTVRCGHKRGVRPAPPPARPAPSVPPRSPPPAPGGRQRVQPRAPSSPPRPAAPRSERAMVRWGATLIYSRRIMRCPVPPSAQRRLLRLPLIATEVHRTRPSGRYHSASVGSDRRSLRVALLAAAPARPA